MAGLLVPSNVLSALFHLFEHSGDDGLMGDANVTTPTATKLVNSDNEVVAFKLHFSF